MIRSLFELEINAAAAIRHRFNRRLSEWHLAGVMLASGLVFMFGRTFSMPVYALVQQIADQGVWAWAMTTVGVVRILVLAVNGAVRRGSPHLRSALASISALIWSVMLAGLLSYNAALQLGPWLAAAIVVDLVNAFRAAQDARREDERVNGADGQYRSG